MIALRFKPLKDGRFSAYLDIYVEEENGRKKRKYEFLKQYFSKDYSDEETSVKKEDKEALEVVHAIKKQYEIDVLKGDHGLRKKQTPASVDFLSFLDEEVRRKKKNKEVNDALLK